MPSSASWQRRDRMSHVPVLAQWVTCLPAQRAGGSLGSNLGGSRSVSHAGSQPSQVLPNGLSPGPTGLSNGRKT